MPSAPWVDPTEGTIIAIVGGVLGVVVTVGIIMIVAYYFHRLKQARKKARARKRQRALAKFRAVKAMSGGGLMGALKSKGMTGGADGGAGGGAAGCCALKAFGGGGAACGSPFGGGMGAAAGAGMYGACPPSSPGAGVLSRFASDPSDMTAAMAARRAGYGLGGAGGMGSQMPMRSASVSCGGLGGAMLSLPGTPGACGGMMMPGGAAMLGMPGGPGMVPGSAAGFAYGSRPLTPGKHVASDPSYAQRSAQMWAAFQARHPGMSRPPPMAMPGDALANVAAHRCSLPNAARPGGLFTGGGGCCARVMPNCGGAGAAVGMPSSGSAAADPALVAMPTAQFAPQRTRMGSRGAAEPGGSAPGL